MKNKILQIAVFAVAGLFLFLISSPASAQSVANICAQDPNSQACTGNDPCYNPTSGTYNTKTCIESRLGLSAIDTSSFIIKRDPNSLFIVVFKIIIYIAIVLTVGRIAFIGIQIGGSREDADKIKELFTALIWTIVGLVIALSALGITLAVQTWFFGKSFEDQIVDCKDLSSLPDTQQSADIKALCAQYLEQQSQSSGTQSKGGQIGVK